MSSYYFLVAANAADVIIAGRKERRQRQQQRQRRFAALFFFCVALTLVCFPPAIAIAIAVDASASASASASSGGRRNSATATSIPFQYSDQDVQECANEMSVEEERSEEANNNEDGDSSSSSNSNSSNNATKTCTKLYNEFRLHYHGIGPVITDSSESSESIPSSESESESESSESSLILPSGLTHFRKTVQYVHEHNTYSNNASSHKLRLNQFADTSQSYYSKQPKQRDSDPTFVVAHQEGEEEEKEEGKHHPNWQTELEMFWNEHMNDNENDDENEPNHRLLRWEGTDVRLLDTPSSIDQQQQQQLRRSLKWKRKRSSTSTSSTTTNPLLSSVLRTIEITSSNTNNGQHYSHTKVMMPGDGSTVPAAFSSPQVPTFIHGTEVELHKGSSKDIRHTIKQEEEEIDIEEESMLFGKKKKKHKKHEHEFTHKLNWSTNHNPDGVPLVHNVFDQGTCGSCWAFAATGSVEASAARNTARNHFVDGLQEISEKLLAQKIANKQKAKSDDDDDDDFVDRHHSDNGYYTLIEELTNESREVEINAFQELNLSIQELLDCDTNTNEGCIGGNPLLAFYYIHKHGLVPWKEYPYVGYGDNGYSRYDGQEEEEQQEQGDVDHAHNNEGTKIGTTATETTEEQEEEDEQQKQASTSTSTSTSLLSPPKLGPLQPQQSQQQKQQRSAPICKKNQIQNPIASVESWGLLHKNHEDLIEYALLYVGPVAVGFNGADPSFINYGNGIFNAAYNDCDQTANHALLIVGFDQEDVVVTTTNDEDDNGTTTNNNTTETIRYWIARNSWGFGWGENGYVKIKRGTGGKGIPGVCGIARSPSVALGGKYRGGSNNRMDPFIVRDGNGKNGDASSSSSSSAAQYRKDKYGDWNDSSSASLRIGMRTNHPVCNSMFTGRGTHLYNGCFKFANAYENNQAVFLALICLVCALIAVIPLTISIFRQHRTARGAGSIRLEYYGDEDPAMSSRLSERSLRGTGGGGGAANGSGSGSGSSHPTERTHLLTLKDMYASQRKENELKQKPRGRSIIMTSPEQDPFHLVPSSTIDTDDNIQ